MTIEQFKELMKQGNKAITGGMINLTNNDKSLVATIEFDDISCDEDGISFSYVDRQHDMATWRGERAQFYGLPFKSIMHIKQFPVDDNLFGAYFIMVHMPNMTANICFDVVEGFDVRSYGMNSTDVLKRDIATKSFDLKNEIEEVAKNKEDIIHEILSHDGSILINVNAGDFVQSKGFEAFNLIFTNIKSLRKNELISFNNSTMQPIRFTEKNVPVYPMGFSANFYVEINNIESIQEMDVEDYADVFEYPTSRIFNFHMKDGVVITIGLDD